MVWSYIHNDQQNLLDKEKKLDITPEQEASENKINAMGETLWAYVCFSYRRSKCFTERSIIE